MRNSTRHPLCRRARRPAGFDHHHHARRARLPRHGLLVRGAARGHGAHAGPCQRRDGVWWVANPVQPKENFADRWRTRPGSDERFFSWLAHAQADFAEIGKERGLDRVLGKVAKSFGEGPARRAGTKYGVELRDARDAGRLGMAAGSGTLGALGTKATRPVRPHTFHGDTPERP